MNQTPFSQDGTQVTDTTGKAWTTEEWHPGLIPSFGGKLASSDIILATLPDYWAVRKPMGAPPKPKTQEDIDFDSYYAWVKERQFDSHPYLKLAWDAGIAHARKGTK